MSVLCSRSARSSPSLLLLLCVLSLLSIWDLPLGYCVLPDPFLAASTLAFTGLSLHFVWHFLTSAGRGAMSHFGCWDLPGWWGHLSSSLLTGDGNQSLDITNFTLNSTSDPNVNYYPFWGGI